jgi:hypothetical protein
MEIQTPNVPPEVLKALERGTTYTYPQTIYHWVELDYQGVYVGVFGCGEDASYEWFIVPSDLADLRVSDCGYGSISSALCCGLVEAGAERPAGDHDLVLRWERKRS